MTHPDDPAKWDKCLLCGSNSIEVKDSEEECLDCGWTYQYRTQEMEKEILQNKIFKTLDAAEEELPPRLYWELVYATTDKIYGKR